MFSLCFLFVITNPRFQLLSFLQDSKFSWHFFMAIETLLLNFPTFCFQRKIKMFFFRQTTQLTSLSVYESKSRGIHGCLKLTSCALAFTSVLLLSIKFPSNFRQIFHRYVYTTGLSSSASLKLFHLILQGFKSGNLLDVKITFLLLLAGCEKNFHVYSVRL